MILSQFKTDFQKQCNPYFSIDEIKSFWMWFEENLKLERDIEIAKIKYQNWLDQLFSGKPIQYIFGYGFFHKYCYFVSSDTLIPRPETEELCEFILKQNKNDHLNCIDIGTGTGCIPITLLNERSNWNFTAVDISENALKIAEKNAYKYEVQLRLKLNHQNFLDNCSIENEYDIIVSNPPYIDPNELTKLDNRVTQHEPHIALFVKKDIMEFYTALLQFFENNTNNNAQLWMETHQNHCDDVVAIFNKKFNAKKIEDLSLNPRFVYVVKK